MLILNLLENAVNTITGNADSNNTPQRETTTRTRTEVKETESNCHYSSTSSSSEKRNQSKSNAVNKSFNDSNNTLLSDGLSSLDIFNIREISTSYESLSREDQAYLDGYDSEYY